MNGNLRPTDEDRKRDLEDDLDRVLINPEGSYTEEVLDLMIISRVAIIRAIDAEKKLKWQPIETAPKDTELLVGKIVDGEWRICQSGFYTDREHRDEDYYWHWYCDFDPGGITDDEGPSHWMPLPEPPKIVDITDSSKGS